MLIRPEFAPLIIGSKVGAGIQGPTDFGQIDRCFDPVLVLSPDAGYCEHLGPRAWYRVMHDSGSWKNPNDWAKRCVFQMAAPYRYGVRNLIPLNEVIALEGLGASETDYAWLRDWALTFLDELFFSLELSGMPDVRVWLFGMSPDHQESDGFQGYRLLEPVYRLLQEQQRGGILVHHYWTPDSGTFLDGADAIWFSQRIEMDYRLLHDELGIDLPWAIGEFNRKVNRADPGDVAAYLDQVQRFYRYVNSLDYVVAAFIFLATNYAGNEFDDLSLVRMPGAFDVLAQFDRQSRTGSGTLPPTPPVDSGWHPAFAGYVARHRTWIPTGEAGTDEWGTVSQDYHYTVKRSGRRIDGVLRTGTSNGYEPGVVYTARYA